MKEMKELTLEEYEKHLSKALKRSIVAIAMYHIKRCRELESVIEMTKPTCEGQNIPGSDGSCYRCGIQKNIKVRADLLDGRP